MLFRSGAPGARFAKEGISKYYANFVLDKVWGAANDAGYGDYFVNEDGGYITDDHYYVNKIAGIPSIDIIDLYPDTESGFYPYWHTVNDTFDKIDKNTLKAVGQTVTNVIYSEK